MSLVVEEFTSGDHLRHQLVGFVHVDDDVVAITGQVFDHDLVRGTAESIRVHSRVEEHLVLVFGMGDTRLELLDHRPLARFNDKI